MHTHIDSSSSSGVGSCDAQADDPIAEQLLYHRDPSQPPVVRNEVLERLYGDLNDESENLKARAGREHEHVRRAP